MTFKTLPDIQFLRECFSLDPETGKLTWNARPDSHFSTLTARSGWNTKYAGSRADKDSPDGYRRVRWSVNGRAQLCMAHRIVFSLHHNRHPEGFLDHKDGNPRNNAPDNLRECDRFQNMANKARNAGKTLPKGVYLSSDGRALTAAVRHEGKSLYLGRFINIKRASDAYSTKAKELFGEFYRPDA